MLHLCHTKYSKHAQPRFQPSNCFILLTFSNFFNFHAMQYMSVSHGHSTIGGIEYDGGEDKKEKIVSHQLGVSMAMEMPINRYQCK